MNKKQLIELLGGIFIAVIFISSYANRVDYNSFNGTNATTTINGTTVYGVGLANAMIVGYYPGITATVLCKNTILANSTLLTLSNTLTALENNNSISNFLPVSNKMIISTGTMNASALYRYTNSQLNSTSSNCTSFSGSATISLPPTLGVVVTIPGQQNQKATLRIPPGERNSSISVNFTSAMTANVPVRVSALIYQNGTIQQLGVART